MEEQLIQKFLKIKNKGWIKTLRKGSTGVGYTFESLLKIEENSLFIADFGDIEIKTHRKESDYKIHLFSLTPDGDYLFPIKNIVNELGYPDKDYPMYKVFNMEFNGIKFKRINRNTFGKLEYKNKLNKLYLILVKENKRYPLYISWSYEEIKKRINLKIKKIAIIEVDSKYMEGEEYFYYNKMYLYKIKNEDKFIELIKNGIISINFKIGIKKNEKDLGKIKDRGTNFSISFENIEELFNLYKIIK